MRLLGKLGPALERGMLFPSEYGLLWVRGVEVLARPSLQYSGCLRLFAWSALDDDKQFTMSLDWQLFMYEDDSGMHSLVGAVKYLSWVAHNPQVIMELNK